MNNFVHIIKTKPKDFPFDVNWFEKCISKKCPINGQYSISK